MTQPTLTDVQSRLLDEVRNADGPLTYGRRQRRALHGLANVHLVRILNEDEKSTTVEELIPDRETAKSLKLPRRSELTPGMGLHIDGIRGECTFVRHTKHANGTEWIDVLTNKAKPRTVDPVRITKVHRRQGPAAAWI